MEGDLSHLEKSERFFRLASHKKDEDEDLGAEVKRLEEIDDAEKFIGQDFKYLSGYGDEQWDKDTYNAKGALHGDHDVQALERSKTKENPGGTYVPEPEEEDDSYIYQDENKLTDLRDLARFSNDRAAERVQVDYKEWEDARAILTNQPNEGLGSGASSPKSGPKSTKKSPKVSSEGERKGDEMKSTEERKDEVAAQSTEVEKTRKKSPYEFNPEEDEVFPKKPQKDRSHDKTRKNIEKKKERILQSVDADGGT